MVRKLFPLSALIVLLLGGCTMAPSYRRPEAPVPPAWPSGPAYPAPAAEPDEPTRAAEIPWQSFFLDERLRQIIETALRNNRDLRLAALNVERARALYGIQRADLLPALNARGTASGQRVPADLSVTGRARTVEQFGVDLGIASWEIDFFGRIQSLKDRALEEYLGTEQARRGAQILLVAEVAGAYLLVASNRESLRVARATLETQQAALQLIQRRHEVGLASELAVREAETQVESARVDMALYTRRAAQAENALNLLAGGPVPDPLLPEDLKSVRPPLEIFAGLSSELLLRRPDILQAENQLRAAHASIGAARAAFFPRITLSTAVGTASEDLSGLFTSGSETWNYAPQIVLPIFDARLWSALKASKVEREIAVARYEKAIQTAFREVADALADRGTLGDQLSAQQSLVDRSDEAYRLYVKRYAGGVDSYLGVLYAQRSLYAAEQGLVSLRLAALASQVRLYAVLGGGADPS